MPKDLTSQYEQKLLKLISSYSRKIQAIYYDAIVDITFFSSMVTVQGQAFNLDMYPAIKQKMDEIIKQMHSSITANLTTSIHKSWELSNEKNDDIAKLVTGNPNKLPASVKDLVYNPNAGALEQFIKRKEKGLNLSDRVWKLLEPYKHELEAGLTDGIGKGRPATEMARDLKRNLREPDRLFRRVRDGKGVLQLSRKAKAYHPGQGVYRSSYKNAFRLTRSETNIAYRSSDHERWKRQDFVKGIRVSLSNAHPKFDICDSMVGDYPKDYKHVGFHPQCICYATPILATPEEYSAIEDETLGITDKKPNLDLVKDIPDGAKEWISKNADRIKGWKNTPYFIKDNSKYVGKLLKKKK